MLNESLLKKLPTHILKIILRYTTALRPKYLDGGFFKIPITKQWCWFCGEKVQRNLTPPCTIKCSECWNVMCLKCVQTRSSPNNNAVCCHSRHRILCFC